MKIVKCPECNNKDRMKIRCVDKEVDGTLIYKCFLCKNKFKIKNKCVAHACMSYNLNELYTPIKQPKGMNLKVMLTNKGIKIIG